MKLLLPLLFLLPLTAQATEGLWLPLLLENLNEAEMHDLGMEITAEDIYSINRSSLKDAIVHFGGFCTGEVISDRGLLLTNHHCGYGQIQRHSSLENNYLEEGFWARSQGQELPNPGLFVTFIERIEDVSKRVLAGVDEGMGEADRKQQIAENIEKLKGRYRLGDFEDVLVKPFYGGNQYFAFVTKTYSDVRLVGAPPSSIGKFGADTDNWEWPRHTGDFSLFRIYAGPDGNPAEYAEDNVPLVPKHHLEISIAGIKEGDFSLVFGFPGTTDAYLPASALAQRTEVVNPIRVGMRDRSLAVIDSAMRNDPQIKIDYASKQARIANAWKKWRGESEGVRRVKAVQKRRDFEAEFRERLAARPAEAEGYIDLLPQLDRHYGKLEPYARTRAYVGELNYNIDLFRIANILARQFKVADNNGMEAFAEHVPRLIDYLETFYTGYVPAVDRGVARNLLDVYYTEVDPDNQVYYVRDQLEFAGSLDRLVNDLFQRSYLTRGNRLIELLRKDPAGFIRQVRGDMGFQFVRQLNAQHETDVIDPYNQIQERIAPLQRRYLDGLMTFFPKRRFHPDANATLRVSYGQFQGFTGPDGQPTGYQTYLDGVIAKHQPGDYEFDIPQKLLDLHEAQDYGPYADSTGRLPVCVLGSNHTTGGNSGSPALNGKGQLVALNFDRTWQSTMSDVYYNPTICRNIMVDIRYVLFLIDKLGGAGYLVEEMTVVPLK